MSQLVVGEYVKSFDDRVYELLADTPFNVGEEFSKTLQRAKNHRECGKFDVGVRCANADCGTVLFRYRRDCHLRGCRSCWRRLRFRLVNLYGTRLSKYSLSVLRFITLSYRWDYTESVSSSASFLMRCVNEWRRFSKFRGALISVEATEKIGGFWYVHIHGIVVGHVFDYSAMGEKWLSLTGSRNARFEEVRSRNGVLFYILKYVVKDWIVNGSNPVEYVSLLKFLYRKKLVRAFGCLYGSRKRVLEKPRLVGISLGGDEDQALDEDESSVASVIPVGYSTNSSSERTCPRCLGHNFVWFEEPHVEDRSVEVVLGGAG